MMYFAVLVLSALLSVSPVSSAFLDRRESFALGILQARQTSANACTSICTPFQNSITDCSTTQCFCTTAIEQSLQDCVNCAVAASSTPAVIASAQNLTSLFEQACVGKNLPTVTIPGLLPANPSATSGVPVSTSTSAGNSASGSVGASTTPSPTIILPTVLPTQVTIRPSDTATSPASGSSQTSVPASAAFRTEVGKMLLVGFGAIFALGLF